MPRTHLRAFIGTTAITLILSACAAAPQYSPAEQEMSETMGKDSFQPATRALRDSIETQEVLAQAAFWMREYELNPADLEAAIKLSAAIRKVGNPQRAVEITQTTRALYPRDPYLTAEYAAALIASGRAGDAIEPLGQALGYAPAYGRLWSLKGAALDQQEQYELARKHYGQALKITPSDPSVMANLGLSYALSGDPQNAEIWLRRAASIPGASKSVHQNLALVLQIQGKTEEADKMARLAATQSSGQMPRFEAQPAHSLRGAVPSSSAQPIPRASQFTSPPPRVTTSNSPSAAMTAQRPSRTQRPNAIKASPSASAQTPYQASTSPYSNAKSASDAARMAAQQSGRRPQVETITAEQRQQQNDILAKLAGNVGAKPANPALRQQAIQRQGVQHQGVMGQTARNARPTGQTTAQPTQQTQQTTPYYPGRQQQPQAGQNPYAHSQYGQSPNGQAYPPQPYGYNPAYPPQNVNAPSSRGAARTRR